MKILASFRVIGAIAIALLVSGCAHVPPASDPAALAAFQENNDRLEPLNRAMFKVDQAADRALIHPIISTYHHVVPTPMRRGLLNFKHNIGEPVTFVHNILQGQPTAAGAHAGTVCDEFGYRLFRLLRRGG